jgi:hypothetical protein
LLLFSNWPLQGAGEPSLSGLINKTQHPFS